MRKDEGYRAWEQWGRRRDRRRRHNAVGVNGGLRGIEPPLKRSKRSRGKLERKLLGRAGAGRRPRKLMEAQIGLAAVDLSLRNIALLPKQLPISALAETGRRRWRRRGSRRGRGVGDSKFGKVLRFLPAPGPCEPVLARWLRRKRWVRSYPLELGLGPHGALSLTHG